MQTKETTPIDEQFLRDGYTVLHNIIPPELISKCNQLSQRILQQQKKDKEYQENHKSIGSLFDVLSEPDIIELITWPDTIRKLKTLGFMNPYFQYGIVFNKLPKTPATFWHQDCSMWNDDCSYQERPQEVTLIHYLQDTNEKNGCLRVIPGSHRYRHSLHEFIQSSYTPDLRKMKDPNSPAFRSYEDEVAVPVQAGDVLVVDCRLLHAAFANQTDEERVAIGLFLISLYDELPERLQARFTWEAELNDRYPFIPDFWPSESKSKLASILPPRYQGKQKSLPFGGPPEPEKMLAR